VWRGPEADLLAVSGRLDVARACGLQHALVWGAVRDRDATVADTRAPIIDSVTGQAARDHEKPDNARYPGLRRSDCVGMSSVISEKNAARRICRRDGGSDMESAPSCGRTRCRCDLGCLTGTAFHQGRAGCGCGSAGFRCAALLIWSSSSWPSLPSFDRGGGTVHQVVHVQFDAAWGARCRSECLIPGEDVLARSRVLSALNRLLTCPSGLAVPCPTDNALISFRGPSILGSHGCDGSARLVLEP
jgi:hypothetical protein